MQSRKFSLLFLILLVIYQYGKVLNYRECPHLPASATAMLTCVCTVTQTAEPTTHDGQPGAEKQLTRGRTDEWFTVISCPKLPANLPASSLNYLSRRAPAPSAGFDHTIFQPPKFA